MYGMGKRSRLEIYYDVLEIVISGETKPTRIMYGSNLSWNNLNQILDNLIEQGFLERRKVKRSYRHELASTRAQKN